MGAMMRAEPGLSLKDAYERACYANPGVRAKIESAAKAVADREAARRNREKAANAQRAGTQISGASGEARGGTAPTSDDPREVVRQIMREKGHQV
jgi:hypothetical protein